MNNPPPSESLVAQANQGRKMRPFVWGGVILSLVGNVAVDIWMICILRNNYPLSIADIVSASGYAMGGMDNSRSYPGYLISAGLSFHSLMLTILFGAGIVAMLRRYYRLQDSALEAATTEQIRGRGRISINDSAEKVVDRGAGGRLGVGVDGAAGMGSGEGG